MLFDVTEKGEYFKYSCQIALTFLQVKNQVLMHYACKFHVDCVVSSQSQVFMLGGSSISYNKCLFQDDLLKM